MSILSVRSNNLFSIGNCPECSAFCEKRRRRYDQDPTLLDKEFKQIEERGIVKVNKSTLTLILKDGDKKIKEVEIEGVDRLQCLFFISHLLEDKYGCNNDECELSCCVVDRLNMVLGGIR